MIEGPATQTQPSVSQAGCVFCAEDNPLKDGEGSRQDEGRERRCRLLEPSNGEVKSEPNRVIVLRYPRRKVIRQGGGQPSESNLDWVATCENRLRERLRVKGSQYSPRLLRGRLAVEGSAISESGCHL